MRLVVNATERKLHTNKRTLNMITHKVDSQSVIGPGLNSRAGDPGLCGVGARPPARSCSLPWRGAWATPGASPWPPVLRLPSFCPRARILGRHKATADFCVRRVPAALCWPWRPTTSPAWRPGALATHHQNPLVPPASSRAFHRTAFGGGQVHERHEDPCNTRSIGALHH